MKGVAPLLSAGATAYGSHYLSTWDICERLGFLRFLAPHPHGGRGLRPAYPAGPLRLGGIVHEGLAAYYLSGPDNPSARDVDYAVARLEAAAAVRATEWETDEDRERDLARGRALIYDYHQFWRGDPDIIVLSDQDGPLVEREFVVPIPGSDIPLTCRPDLVARWKDRWVYVLEHKTTSVWRVSKLRAAMRVNLQGSGECYVLSRDPRTRHLSVAGVMPNLLLKDRSSKSRYQPFERDTAARTEAQLRMFEAHVRQRHERLKLMEEQWQAKVAGGADPWDAAAEVYVANGAGNGRCEDQFGRPCEMLGMCAGVGMERIHAEGFVASIEARGDADADYDG